jgi:Arc/MetJ-type ribon-helix-helix transcriptional regulator
MIESLPSDIQHFIHAQVSLGKYFSNVDLVEKAVRLLRDREDDYQRLRAEIRRRFAEVDAGNYIELNGDEELANSFDEIMREVDAELAGKRGGSE